MKQLQKSMVILTLLLLTVATALAGPANPDPIETTQPDGSVITIRMRGDEFQNWTELEATGHTIVRNPSSGYWEYAEQNPDGTLRGSGIIVQPKGENAPAGTPKGIKPSYKKDSARQMDQLLQDLYRERLDSARGLILPDVTV